MIELRAECLSTVVPALSPIVLEFILCERGNSVGLVLPKETLPRCLAIQ